MDEYQSYTIKELKSLLLLRGLQLSGRKADLIARLLGNNEPRRRDQFPFMKLPPEIRNMIYGYLAPQILTEEEADCQSILKRLGPRPSEPAALAIWSQKEINLTAIIQPGLFRTGKLARKEGCAMFYRHHDFTFFIQDTVVFYQQYSRWLRAIGQVGRCNLRSLTMNVYWVEIVFDAERFARFMRETHAILPDHVTVVYSFRYVGRPQDRAWGVARWFFSSKDSSRPKLLLTTTDGISREYSIEEMENDPSVYRIVGCESRLVFEPGHRWFGSRSEPRLPC